MKWKGGSDMEKKMLVRYHIHSFFVKTVTDDLNDLN